MAEIDHRKERREFVEYTVEFMIFLAHILGEDYCVPFFLSQT